MAKPDNKPVPVSIDEQIAQGRAKDEEARVAAEEKFASVVKAAAAAGEDWFEDVRSDKPAAEPGLAGLYRATHATIFFSKDKIVKKGRKVRLTAEEAHALLRLDAPTVDPETGDEIQRPEPHVEQVA